MAALPRYESPVPRGGVALAVADRLREAVLSEYADGECLGSEDDLVLRYGVSRPTLRQAIRVLQTEGLLTVRRGNNGGFFASQPSTQTVARTASLLLRYQGATSHDLVAVSLLIAPELAALAANNHDQEARTGLLTFAREAWSTPAEIVGPEVVRVAAEFGHRLGRLAANPALALFTAVLSDLVFVGAASLDSEADAAVLAALADHLRKSHIQVARAVSRGDAKAASRAIRRMVNVSV